MRERESFCSHSSDQLSAQSVDLRSGGNQPLVVSVRGLIHALSHGVFTEVACCCLDTRADIFPVQMLQTLGGTGSRQQK